MWITGRYWYELHLPPISAFPEHWPRVKKHLFYWAQTSIVVPTSSCISNHISSVQLLGRVWLLQSHGLQHTRRPCPSSSPRACSNSCQSSWWCHPTISSSVIPFSSCPQPFPASGSFPMSQLFASGGQSIRASASASLLPASVLFRTYFL